MLRQIMNETKNPFGEPTIIFMIGGVGAGKNYIADKYFKGIPIIDPDDHTLELAKGDHALQRKFIQKAIVWVNKETDKASLKGRTTIVMGTGANFKGFQNKLQRVKDLGMSTALIFVNANPTQAELNNQKRIADGGRGSTIPDYKFKTSFDKAEYTFTNLKDTDVCDFSKEIKNG